MQLPLAVRLLAGAAFVLMAAVLFVGGAQPGAAGLFEEPWDKVVHFVYFGLMTGFAMVATALRRPWSVFAAVILIGVADELAQAQLPGRHADVRDLATDAAGAAVAVMMLVAARRHVTRFAPYRPPS